MPRYVYVEHSSNEQELYDLAADPHQLTSLHASAAHAPLKAELAARLARLRACAAGVCRQGAALGLSVRYKRGRSKGRVCARGPVVARVGGADAGRVSAVHFYAGDRADRPRPPAAVRRADPAPVPAHDEPRPGDRLPQGLADRRPWTAASAPARSAASQSGVLLAPDLEAEARMS